MSESGVPVQASSASMIIPTFRFSLTEMSVLNDSLTRFRKGDGQYDSQDVCILSDWIAICALNYMIDDYEKKKNTVVTSKHLQDYEFYFLQCSYVCDVANTMLKKTPIDFTWCNTHKPCQGLQTHSSVLAHFYPEDGRKDVLYDFSLRQFFDTDEKGQLRDKRWRGKTSRFVAQNMIADEERRKMSDEILTTGSSFVYQEDMALYVKAFAESMNSTDDRFFPTGESDLELVDQFIQNENYRRDDPDPYAYWAIWPDEEGVEERAILFLKRANALRAA